MFYKSEILLVDFNKLMRFIILSIFIIIQSVHDSFDICEIKINRIVSLMFFLKLASEDVEITL